MGAAGGWRGRAADGADRRRPIRSIALNVFKAYLWPLLVPALLVFGLALLTDRSGAGITRAVMVGWDVLIATLLAAVAALGIVYVVFRRMEARDVPEQRAPDPDKVAAVVARENFHAHNHLAAVSVIKPGLLRRVALKVVFAASPSSRHISIDPAGWARSGRFTSRAGSAFQELAN